MSVEWIARLRDEAESGNLAVDGTAVSVQNVPVDLIERIRERPDIVYYVLELPVPRVDPHADTWRHLEQVGAGTGHVLARCTTCRRPSLVAALASTGKNRKTWPTCRMTPGCDGRHQASVDQLETVEQIPPPAQAKPPPRPDRRRLLGPVEPWPTRHLQIESQRDTDQ